MLTKLLRQTHEVSNLVDRGKAEKDQALLNDKFIYPRLCSAPSLGKDTDKLPYEVERPGPR